MGFFGDIWNDITGVTASNNATSAMNDASQASIAQQQAALAEYKGMASPYMEAGNNALQSQQALSGALGPVAQQQAINAIQNGAGYQSQLQAGETSILQNAAATGGVRGGNTQGALAQYAPALLSNAIDQQYSQLSGLSSMGQNAMAQYGNASTGTAQNVGNVYSQMGQASAANSLGAYTLQKDFLGDIAGFGLNVAGLAAGGA